MIFYTSTLKSHTIPEWKMCFMNVAIERNMVNGATFRFINTWHTND